MKKIQLDEHTQVAAMIPATMSVNDFKCVIFDYGICWIKYKVADGMYQTLELIV